MATTLIDTKPTTNGHAPAATLAGVWRKRTVYPGQRRAEIVIAAIFLLTAATSMFGAFALEPGLYGADYLSANFPGKATAVLNAVLWSFNNVAIVFIAVFAFPLLKRLDEAMALGYLASRILECSVMMVGIAAALLLIPVSEQFLAAGSPQRSWFQTVGGVLLQTKLLGLTLLSLPLLGVGGLFFTTTLFRFRLVPRLISGVGILGYALLIPVSIMGWFGIVDPSPTGNVAVLAVPVASFEILLLPFWLLFKGFAMPAPADAQPSRIGAE